MKGYKERFTEAKGIYELGLQNVLNKPEPKGQKFPVGSRVHINKDLGPMMSHFKSDCNATVKYVYAHAYGGNNVTAYNLDIDNYGSVAWYNESELTAI